MKLSSKNALTSILCFLVIFSLIRLGIAFFAIKPINVRGSIVSGVAILGLIAILVAHLRNWRWAAHSVVLFATLLAVADIPPDKNLYATYLFTALLPTLLATAFLAWYWSAGVFVFALVGILAQTFSSDLPIHGTDLVSIVVMALICVFTTIRGRTAQAAAEESALRAEQARFQSEARKQALEVQTSELAQQNEEQRRLLDLVTTLEVPMVTIAEGVIFAPIVGTLDTRRASALTARLLQSVSSQRARLAILDISGVTSVDTAVARALIESTQAVRLLGCDVTISGISAAVAITLTHLNIDLTGITTTRTPQEALQHFEELSLRAENATELQAVTAG